MKKINYLFLGLAGLALASCSQDDLTNPGTAEDYSLTVSLPADMATRAIGDVATGTNYNLTYYLYDKDGDYIKMTTESTTITVGTPATVNLPLVKGNSYTVVFFAQSEVASESGAYTLDASAKTLTVNYGKMSAANNAADAYDCFYANYPINNVGENISDKVQLTRPMAQINWGTNDLNEPSVKDAFMKDSKSTMVTTLKMEANNVLNLLDGTVSGETTAAEIYTGFATSAYSEMTYPAVSSSTDSNYEYLAMQYVLAGAASTTNNLTLTVGGNNDGEPIEIVVNNVPLQANYRTNIYGSLLTDQASLSVEVNADWYEPANDISLVWDGTTATSPTIDTEKMTATINSASDLAGLANLVKGKSADGTAEQSPNDFSGYTVELSADFDLAGHPFPGIGSATRSGESAASGSTSFAGVFDGQGHTISNVSIAQASDGSKSDCIAFIPNLSGENAAVKDVIFENLQIEGGTSEQAGVVGIATGGSTISGVIVNSGSISSAGSTGAIAGRMMRTGTISDCHNNGAAVTGGEKCGGIIGAAYYNTATELIQIKGCTNSATVTGTLVVGGIVGLNAGDITLCTNTGSVISSSSEVGGIVGWQSMGGSINNCVNSGTVTATGSIVGGIVGNISYSNISADYPYKGDIKIDGNRNSAVITGAGEVGGIVGRFNSPGICINNTNTASSLVSTGNSTVAGIVGNIQGTGIQVAENSSTTSTDNMTGKTKADLYNGPYTQYTE